MGKQTYFLSVLSLFQNVIRKKCMQNCKSFNIGKRLCSQVQKNLQALSISKRWIWNPALSNQQKALSMFVHENICKMNANIGEQHQKHVLTCKAIMNREKQSSTKTISQQKQAWLITSKNKFHNAICSANKGLGKLTQ